MLKKCWGCVRMKKNKILRSWLKVKWQTVQYSKNKIKKAGIAISCNDFTDISNEEALKIINNWRASHAFPLHTFYVNCKNKVKRFNGAIAVQRLKRLESIVDKLSREDEMSIVRMQDLGGCRMIMENIEDVYEVINDIKKSRIRHQLIKTNDYIENPKPYGYRSVHLVYKYYSDKKATYNGMLIEIQVRTRLQHLWATAIEILQIYTKSNLKASMGDEKILRYMELISALFAIKEKTPLSPTVPTSKEQILSELKTLDDVNFFDILDAVKTALKITDINDLKIADKKNGYYILKINFDTKSLNIRYFAPSKIELATRIYEEIERQNTHKQIDVVLVAAADMDTLTKAYPNYFADVNAFKNAVIELIH